MAATFNWQDYIGRVHDLNGMISLVLLQGEIEAGRGRRVEDVLQSSVHRNPFTAKTMDYDAGAGTLGFPCVAGYLEEVCRIRL